MVTAVIAKEKTQVGELPILVRGSRDAAWFWSLIICLSHTACAVGDVSLDQELNLRHDSVVSLVLLLSNFLKRCFLLCIIQEAHARALPNAYGPWLEKVSAEILPNRSMRPDHCAGVQR